jgi:hypothetical protein
VLQDRIPLGHANTWCLTASRDACERPSGGNGGGNGVGKSVHPQEPFSPALIFSLEPVFAALTSRAVTKEHLGGKVLVGAARILTGMVISEAWGGGRLPRWKGKGATTACGEAESSAPIPGPRYSAKPHLGPFDRDARGGARGEAMLAMQFRGKAVLRPCEEERRARLPRTPFLGSLGVEDTSMARRLTRQVDHLGFAARRGWISGRFGLELDQGFARGVVF